MLIGLLATAVAGTLSDAVASGDCTTLVARTTPFDSQIEQWRVPRAWCLLKLGDAKGADAMLGEPLPDGVMGEYGRLIQARARIATEDFEGAQKLLDGLKLPGKAGDEVSASLSEVMAARGNVAGIKARMSSLGAKGNLLLGEALHRSGDALGAERAWRKVWTDAAVGGFDTLAEQKLTAVGAKPFTADERNRRLTSLRKNKRIDDAADLAGDVTSSGQSSSPVQLAKILLAARNYPEALVQWERALGAPDKAVGSASLLFDYALTHARTGDYETAAVVYRRVIAQHPGHAKAEYASYKLGYMAYDKGDCDRAVPLYAKHLSAYPSSKRLDEALWFTSRCHWRASETDKAVAALDRLIRARPKSSLVQGARYWKARSLGMSGDTEGEKKALESIIRSYPSGGYAWFAAHRLGRTFPAKPVVSRPAWPDALAGRRDVKRAEALLAVGFRDWARDELAPVKPALKGKEAALAGAWAFIAAGDYRTGKSLAKPYCVRPWKGGDPVAQQACTPRPEAAIVEKVAERFDLYPLLPYGIMTAESALKPWVTSRAGARGLMQMMPKEGPRVHANLYPERPYDADDLYSAPYNASMGTAELGLRRQSLDGVLEGTDLPAVIASYNGGEEAVRRWLEAYEEPPPFDEFSEEIGYTETRKYVKRVLGFVMNYRWVYGDPGPSRNVDDTP